MQQNNYKDKWLYFGLNSNITKIHEKETKIEHIKCSIKQFEDLLEKEIKEFNELVEDVLPC